MGRRRSKSEILRDKQTQWMNWGHNYYAQYQACTQCGSMRYCKGKTSGNLKCDLCHFGFSDPDQLQNALRELRRELYEV